MSEKKNTYSKIEFLELLDTIIDQLQEEKDNVFVVHLRTTIEDLDKQPAKNIIGYLNVLKEIFDQAPEETSVLFNFKLTPFNETVFEMQEKLNSKLEGKNESN